MTKHFFAISFLFLLVQLNGYAIEGTWQSANNPQVNAQIKALTSDADGTINYELSIDTCTFKYSFKIIQSFWKNTNLQQKAPTQTCTSSNALKVSKELQQKMFYFTINDDKLTLITIFGTKTVSFIRDAKRQPNLDLVGQFKDIVTGENVLISREKVYLCGGKLDSRYASDGFNVFTIHGISIEDHGCQNKASQDVLTKLIKSKVYRKENPNLLTFYSQNNVTLQLQFLRDFSDDLIPGQQTTQNNQTNQSNQSSGNNQSAQNNQSIANNQTQNGTNSQQPTNSQNTQNNQNLNNTQKPPTTPTTPVAPQNNQTSQNIQNNQSSSNSQNTQSGQNTQTNQTATPSAPINASGNQGGQSANQNRTQNSTQTSTSASTQTQTQTSSNSSSTSQNSQGSQTSQPQPSQATSQGTQASQNTTQQTPPQNTTTTLNTQPQVTPPPVQPTPSNSVNAYTPVQLQMGLLLTTWDTQFFQGSDSTSWPLKQRFNGTNILFQGCNIVSIPLRIDYTTQNVQTAKDVLKLNGKNCGNQDQLFIDKILQSTKMETLANQTHLLLNFFNNAGAKTFSVARELSSAEKESLIKKSPAPAQSVTNSGIQNPEQPSQSNSQSAVVPSAGSQLVGGYNPTKVHTFELPQVLSRQYIATFTAKSVTFTGTCHTYVYPYTATPQNNDKISFQVNENTMISQPARPGCDPSQDTLYINPLVNSVALKMSKTGGKTVLELLDASDSVIMVLRSI